MRGDKGAEEGNGVMISTRGRYALRVLADLAEHANSGYVPMKEIAERQGISLKYLEQILPVLTRNGIIEGLQGKSGGYRLLKEPAQCRIGDILRLTEGNLAPVACLVCDAKPCERKSECRTYPMWTEFYQVINEFFDSRTLADIVRADRGD